MSDVYDPGFPEVRLRQAVKQVMLARKDIHGDNIHPDVLRELRRHEIGLRGISDGIEAAREQQQEGATPDH